MGPRLPDDGHLQLVDAELAQSREVRGEREGASREIRGSGRIRLEVIELRGEGGSRSGLFRKRRSRGMISDPEACSRILRFPISSHLLVYPCISLETGHDVDTVCP